MKAVEVGLLQQDREFGPLLPPLQTQIWSHCVHRSGTWVPVDPDVGGATIHELIEGQARRRPEAVAVVSPARRVSYGELNACANRLARALVKRRLPVDRPLLVSFPLGAELIVSVLAALKAGHFVAALDLGDPPARARAVVGALDAQAILVDARHRDLARTLVPDVLVVDPDAAADEAGQDPGLPRRADGLARIALTSGSTGEPKGIMQTHRTSLYGAIARNNAVHLCRDDGMLIGTSTFTELWRPLLVGATLYLFDFKRDDLGCLRRWLETGNVSGFRSTPSVFRSLVSTLTPKESPASVDQRGAPESGECAFPSLRVVELMGEPISWECVRLYQRHFPSDCVLVNFLGSKETLDYRVYYVDHATEGACGTVPGGYPLAAAVAKIVDEQGIPVRSGSIGEIVVSTPSLSPGYWLRPELTRARFRDAKDGEDRSYLTGDRGMLLPDGCLVHVGRQDAMVKIRGHQVDVAHVEQLLRQLPSVDDAAVVATATDRGGALVAFVIPRAAGANGRMLRRELASLLPDYMIPSEFRILDELPMTPMGKADRETLRALASAGRPGGSSGAADAPASRPASDPLEADIAAIWALVLKVDSVKRSDDFFEIGGNSLMGMEVLGRIRQRWAIDAPLSVVFRCPTVEALANELRGRMRECGVLEMVPPLHPAGRHLKP